MNRELHKKCDFFLPLPRIELGTHPYHGRVIPFNYKGKYPLNLMYNLNLFKLLP